jgi:hypothetical protein
MRKRGGIQGEAEMLVKLCCQVPNSLKVVEDYCQLVRIHFLDDILVTTKKLIGFVLIKHFLLLS